MEHLCSALKDIYAQRSSLRWSLRWYMSWQFDQWICYSTAVSKTLHS